MPRLASFSLLLSIGAFAFACGLSNGGDNNATPEPVCESVPQPSEMQDCVADVEVGGDVRNREQIQLVCENRCDTLVSFGANSSELTSLSLLNGIRRVKNQFSVNTVVNLTSLEGAGNIEVIGPSEPWQPRGMLSIEDTFALENTDGFSSLKRVQGGNVSFVLNEKLTDISGFPELEEIRGVLSIQLHGNLTDISGFPKLHTVTEGIIIDGNKNLSRCKAQAFVDGIENVGGDVVIQGNGPCE